MTGKIDLRYVVALDAAQANAELARLHKEATTAAGTSDRMTAATKATTAALKEEAAAAGAAAHGISGLRTSVTVSAGALDTHVKKTMSFTDAAKGLQARMGPAAGAVASLSAALGAQGGEAGKALAAIGQLAAAFAAGGPLLLGITAGTLAIDLFLGEMQKAEKAAQDLFDADNKLIDAARARRDEQLKNSSAAAQELRQVEAVNSLRARGFDDEARRTEALGSMQVRYMELVQKIANEKHAAAKGLLQQELRSLGEQMTTTLKTVDAGIEAEKAAARRAKWEARIRADAEATARAVHQQNLETQDSQRASDAAMNAPSSTNSISGAMLGLDAPKETIATILARRESEAIMRENARRVANKKATDDEIERQAQESYARQLSETEAFNSAVGGHAMAAASIVAGASQQLVNDLITGQEKALENFITTIMAQAGQALISQGIQLVGASVVSGLTGNIPAAAAQAGGGAGLIAAGIGLGGAAAAIGNIGGGGRASDARTASLPSSSSRSSSGESSPRSITIVYGGASGPTADHAADAVTSAERRAADRNYDRSNTR